MTRTHAGHRGAGTRRSVLALCAGVATFAFAAAPAGERGNVLEHHGDAARSGMFVVPGLTYERARNLHRDASFRGEVSGSVYAQPLYWRIPGGDRALLLVATEQNLVYALDAATGSTVWKTSLGSPVPRAALPCGNIDPLGITGTPVIDEASRTLYVAALVKAEDGAKHRLFALALESGAIASGWPIDVEGALKSGGRSFRSAVHNQRGALAIVGDTLYVPYSGHFGDCGDYHGWVVGVSLRSSHAVHAWSTRARGGGIWGTGGVASDGRNVYAVTGNTFGAREWADGEAVVRLGTDLSFSGNAKDFFAPSDWQELDRTDADLGGSNALLVSLSGAKPAELVLALGKDGKAYLLDRENLGGIGGSVLAKEVSSVPIRTAAAAFASGDEVRIAFQGRGVGCPNRTSGDLTVIAIAAGSPPALRVAWCASENGRGAPIVTTSDGKANPIVWAVGAEGDNRLHGFRGDNGAAISSGDAMNEVRRFSTLIAAGGRLYVAADSRVYAFAF